MARRVFLHIGVMKSATTYIQHLCDANATTLRQHGVMWQPSLRYHRAVLDLTVPQRLAPVHQGAWDRLCRTLIEHSGDALVSCERLAPLSTLKIQQVGQDLGAEELRVIVTARDLARVAPSQWQESVKNQGQLPWAVWLEKVCQGRNAQNSGVGFWKQQDLPAVLRSWREVASPGHLYVVTVPIKRSRPDIIWRRFAQAIEVPSDLVTAQLPGNPSMGAVSAELMRRLNVMMGPIERAGYIPGFKEALSKQVLVSRASQEPSTGLDAKSHDRIRELAVEMVRELEGMDLTVLGDLADLIPPESADQSRDPVDATDAELLDAALTGLVGLGQRVSDQVGEIRQLRRELRSLRSGRTVTQARARTPPVATWRIRARRRARRLGQKLRRR